MKKRFQKVYIEITNRCNLNCAFCPKTIRKYEDISIEKFEYILKQVKEYTNLIYLHVKGEPLIHPKIKDILYICDKYSMMVNLTTNGVLLKNNIDILTNLKSIRQINISIHSIFENKRSDEEIINYLNSVFDFADKLKKQIIISYRLWNILDIKKNEHNKLALDMLEKKYNIDNLYSLAKENNYIKLDDNIYLNQDIQFKWPNINSEEFSSVGRCLGLKSQIAILVNGDVVPCCLDENANIFLGNIFKEDLKSIINSGKSQKIITGFNNNKLEEKLCRTCGFRKRFDK